MAKKPKAISIQVDIQTEAQWRNLLKSEGLILVDVYSSWCGPCISMLSILRQLKFELNNDRLIFATANSENIEQLKPFKDQSEPCWLFIGGGQPVNLLRGANAPTLLKMIKAELHHELRCLEGKAERNSISIKLEGERREKATLEASSLFQLLELEDEERRNPKIAPKLEVENEEEMDIGVISVCLKEEWSEIKSVEEDKSDDDNHEGTEKVEEPVIDEEIDEVAEAIAEKRMMMEKSNEKLRKALPQCTVIIIQSYLLETGGLTEIKGLLEEKKDFRLIKEKYTSLSEEDARKLFGIQGPEEETGVIQDEMEKVPSSETVEQAVSEKNADEPDIEVNVKGNDDDENVNVIGDGVSTAEEKVEIEDIKANQQVDETQLILESGGNNEGTGAVEDSTAPNVNLEQVSNSSSSPVPNQFPVPKEIVGDTLILLMECEKVEVKKGHSDTLSEIVVEDVESDIIDKDADFYAGVGQADRIMLELIGPEEYDQAIETQPNSLHAKYGKGKEIAGVWCPRTYEDKRFVVLNYFPQYVMELMMMMTTEMEADLVSVETNQEKQEPAV